MSNVAYTVPCAFLVVYLARAGTENDSLEKSRNVLYALSKQAVVTGVARDAVHRVTVRNSGISSLP